MSACSHNGRPRSWRWATQLLVSKRHACLDDIAMTRTSALAALVPPLYRRWYLSLCMPISAEIALHSAVG